MTQGLRKTSPSDLNAELEGILVDQIGEILADRAPGHCMRVGDLDLDLMLGVCRRIRKLSPESQVYVLGDGDAVGDEFVSSTKLVELRNPYQDGKQRPPLLIFIPNELRTSSEDSFGVATFEEVNPVGIYELLSERLLGSFANGAGDIAGQVLTCLGEEGWRWIDSFSKARFLLTVKLNDQDEEIPGAALFELGLAPDFKLHERLDLIRARIRRNLKCCALLEASTKSERARVLDLGFDNADFRREFGGFLAGVGMEDPRKWPEAIISDSGNWAFSYDKWPFEDDEEVPQQICIHSVTTDLPVVTGEENEDNLDRLLGQQILPLKTLRKFGIEFHVNPAPAAVESVKRFRAQLVSKESGVTGIVRNKTAWASGRLSAKLSFNNLRSLDLDEGFYFIRVLAYTSDDDLVPLVDENEEPLSWERPAEGEDHIPDQVNESEMFYVIPDEEIDVDPPQRARQKHLSLMHALFDLRFSAIADNRDPEQISVKDVLPEDGKMQSSSVGSQNWIAKFYREDSVQIAVSQCLWEIEHAILTSPRDCVSLSLQVNIGLAAPPLRASQTWPDLRATERFVDSRESLFKAIRGTDENRICQLVDLRVHRDAIIEYASAYASLLDHLEQAASRQEGAHGQRLIADLGRMAALDSVRVLMRNHQGDNRVAILAGPTHPLRLLWFSQWSDVGDHWLRGAAEASSTFHASTKEAIIEQLSNLGFPSYMPADQGGVYIAVDNLTPFWTIYAPVGEPDPRGLVGALCTLSSVPEPSIGGSTLNGCYLAKKATRYLLQHPYVRTLKINVFNAGHGGLVRDMLLELQKDKTLHDLNYDVRLFVPDPSEPGVGEGLEELVTPARTAAPEADAFLTPGRSHLFPKLAYAVYPISGFVQDHERYPAHLSIIFDLFPPQQISAEEPLCKLERSPIHGLLQAYAISYSETDESVTWKRQPIHGEVSAIDGETESVDLVTSLNEAISRATAAYATGSLSQSVRPLVTLSLKADDRALIHHIHEESDWVFTIDRHLGIEYFDHNRTGERPEYLIDHSNDLALNSGRRMVVTSRSLTEIRLLVKSLLKEYDLDLDPERASGVLDQLRSLSGKLALKLIGSQSHRTEVLGLSLARLFLEHQGVFANQIVIPLDSHLEFYREIRENTDWKADEITLKRTDLALIDLHLEAREVTCRLVEVKCSADIGGVASINRLRSGIAEQIEQSARVLNHHFGPAAQDPDRPDRIVKTRQLVELLSFYLERSCRFESIEKDVADEFRACLHTLESGYSLKFTKSGLIFDLGSRIDQSIEFEEGIEYCHIGRPMIESLLQSLAPPSGNSTSMGFEDEHESSSQERPTVPKQTKVARLEAAAFIAPPRDHTKLPGESSSELPEPAEESGSSSRIDTPTSQLPTQGNEDVTSGNEMEDGDWIESGSEPVVVLPAKQMDDQPSVPHNGLIPDKYQKAADYDVILGASGDSPQYGILGSCVGRKVAIDLNQTHTLSLFGVQGGGKSYTLGALVEMAAMKIPNINSLQSPLATVIFHYSPTQDYSPEFTSMRVANSNQGEINALLENYGADPQALQDIVILTPEDKLEERREEYPDLTVAPIKFAASELKASHWRFLMGAVGNQATYIKQVNQIMRGLRHDLTLDAIHHGIEQSGLSDNLKQLANARLELASTYVDDDACIGELVRPGRLLIVDLRDEFIEKDEALGLFVVLLQIFSDAKIENQKFNKLVVFDEAHKYVENPDLVSGLVEVVREMRHKGTSIMVASQDPPSVPIPLIELSTQIILHKFNSPAWLKHIQKSNAALGNLTPKQMSQLKAGEAYVWSTKASDSAFTNGAVKVQCRPRVTQHGGATQTAV